MLDNRKWQQAPGMAHTFLYPIINKSNLSTSSSFIVCAPNITVIIDPGNSEAQLANIRHALSGMSARGSGPIIACLTHCHVDHCFKFLEDPSSVAPGSHVFVAIQENGLLALGRKDRNLTFAGPYRTKPPDTMPDICLLSAEDSRLSLSKELNLRDGTKMELTARALITPAGNTLHRQDVGINGDMIRAYYTPGHSPDSVSYQMGDILFVGDVMFAAERFVAGIPGWNREEALETAHNLLWLIDKEKISWIAQGHGDIMPAEKACGRLGRMIDGLPGIVMTKELDLQTIVMASEHAIDVSKESADIITTMAEALNHVVHYLGFLDESRAATDYAAAMDSGKINELYAALNEMADQVHSGRLVEASLMLQSAALFSRIRRMLKTEGLECVVGNSLLTRLERLFDDYLDGAAGQKIKRDMKIFGAGAFLRDFADVLKKDIYSDEGIFDTLEDEREFVRSLIRRLAYKSTYRHVGFSITVSSDAMIKSDRSRLEEILEIIVEAMVEEGSKHIVFDISGNGALVSISIDGGLMPGSIADEGYRKRALLRRIGWIDGVLSAREGMIILNLPSGL